MELVAGAGKAPEPQALEAVMRLQVVKAHLGPLSLIARSQERLRRRLAASDIAGSLIDCRARSGAPACLEPFFDSIGHLQTSLHGVAATTLSANEPAPRVSAFH